MAEQASERRQRFLQAVYNLGINEPVFMVSIEDVAKELGMDPDRARDRDGEMKKMAYYFGNKGLIDSQADGYGLLSLTPEGIDEVEGKNKPQESSSPTFQFYGNVQGSVIGTNNSAELTNNFDFRTVEQRIEREGGEDKEELREALEEVRRLLESGDSMERGFLSRFSGAMEEHSWFTSSIAQALVGFGTQAVG